MKAIQTKLIESNERQVHSHNANRFKTNLLNQMNANCIQTKLIESNENIVHLNKAK